MSMSIKQSSTARELVFLMVDETDHITGKTGLTPTVTLSKNGGSFASPAGSVSEVGNGWYKVAGNATDTDTLGSLVLHATATGADPVDMLYEVVLLDPDTEMRGTDGANTTTPLDASGVRGAVGLASANLDDQLGGISDKTNNLPANPAATGDEMDLVDAPNATAVMAIQSGLSTYDGSDTSGTTTLLSRIPDIISLAAIRGQMDAALGSYDAPTNAEMEAAFTTLTNHGNIAWLTATGFATPTNVSDVKDILDDLTEDVGGTLRFTAKALEQAPSGGGGGGGDATAENQQIIIGKVDGVRDTVDLLAPDPGPAPIEYQITIQDTLSNPLAGVAVQLTYDDARQVPATPVRNTNASGIVTFDVSPGDYFMWRQRGDVYFPNPVEITVSA